MTKYAGIGKKLKIAYLSGPCDAPAVFREWTQGEKQYFFGTDYMKLFLQLCEDIDAEAYVITSLSGGRTENRMGRFIFYNNPNISSLRGVRYHLAFLPWFARVVWRIIWYRPDVLLATDNASYWFLLLPLRWFRIPIIPSFHPMLWPQYAPRKLTSRILWQLTRFFILKHLKTMVVISNDITRQLQKLLGTDMAHITVLRHYPSYSHSQFASISPPDLNKRPPFRVFFIGRTETNKGIYDIVEIARRANVERKGIFHFDLCGKGGELDNLKERIADLSLQDVVSCHGYCSPDEVTKLLSNSHAVIVPSKADFDAGYEMVCAEAVLAGRPLIASAVCPALEDVGQAAITVKPDDVDGYYRAILELNDNTESYLVKQSNCASLQPLFYAPENSWYASVKEALERQFPARFH